MKIALFGLPACGKGTQAQKLETNLGLPQLSTGDLIRRLRVNDHGPVGDELRALPVGTFAGDGLMVRAVAQALDDSAYARGVILDGFPRTLAQAEAMVAMGVTLDAVVYFQADEDTLVERAVNRRVHLPSGRIYNVRSTPPKVAGLDDVTGEPLTHRDDDHEDVVRRRFADFHSKTRPALEYLKDRCKTGAGSIYIELNAMDDPATVYERLELELASARPSTAPSWSPTLR